MRVSSSHARGLVAHAGPVGANWNASPTHVPAAEAGIIHDADSDPLVSVRWLSGGSVEINGEN